MNKNVKTPSKILHKTANNIMELKRNNIILIQIQVTLML